MQIGDCLKQGLSDFQSALDSSRCNSPSTALPRATFELDSARQCCRQRCPTAFGSHTFGVQLARVSPGCLGSRAARRPRRPLSQRQPAQRAHANCLPTRVGNLGVQRSSRRCCRRQFARRQSSPPASGASTGTCAGALRRKAVDLQLPQWKSVRRRLHPSGTRQQLELSTRPSG